MPDATLARLIMPTAVAERRPDKAFTPHPAIGARCLMRRLRVLSCLQPLPNVGWIRRLRRIRQFSAPDEGAKCRVALELLIAQTILQGFDAQYGRFLEVTSGAQQRFEQADWHAVQQAMKNRIHLYDHHVGLVVEQLRCITNGQSTDAAFLLRVKEHYTRLLPDYPRFEIAESFFNSVYCRLFDHRSLTPERLFYL